MSVIFAASSAHAELARLCPSRLYPWERAIDVMVESTAIARDDFLDLAWTGHANGITTPGRRVALDDGGEALEWRFKVDHHDKSAYPMGWPNFESYPKKPLDLSGKPILSFRARMVNDIHQSANFRLIIFGGKDGKQKKSVRFTNVQFGEWREFHFPIDRADLWKQVTKVHFYVDECDYRHGDEVAFQLRDFRLGEPSKKIIGLESGKAGASLWVGERGDSSSRAVMLESEAGSLPALLHIDNRLDKAIPANATIAVRLRNVVTGRDVMRQLPLGAEIPAGSRKAVRFAVDLSGLAPSYYHALADILVDSKSVLDIRKGSDDFLIRRPGESMTSSVLLLRMGMAAWTMDRLHGGFMQATDITLPHSYDPYDTTRSAYREFLTHFAMATEKVCEGYEAALPGLALAAEAYRRAGDAERLKFAESLLWNAVESMFTMQDECGGVVYCVNDLRNDGIGFGGSVGRNCQYSTDQTAEWLRALTYATFYYARKGGEEEKIRRLNAACLKTANFLAEYSRWQEPGREEVLQNFGVTFRDGKYVGRTVWHQEGRQCDVYQPRVVAGMTFVAMAFQKTGMPVPDGWWKIFDASAEWMTHKMSANGWFDTQCGDVVEGGCHTFLGNIYLGEGLFGVAMANRLAGRTAQAESAIAAARKAYRYVTDDCWIRGRRFQYPLEFWVGPYVYWLFTEWHRHVGPEPAFDDWLAVLDRRWSVERKWGDFVRQPGMDCGRASANGTLVLSILGYVGLKDMQERGQFWTLFDPASCE